MISPGLGASSPPVVPPAEMVERLTLNGSIPLEYYYVDDSNKGTGMFYTYIQLVNMLVSMLLTNLTINSISLTNFTGTHYKYSHDDITGLISQAQQFINSASSLPTPRAPAKISSSITWLTQLSDIWLVKALKQYPIAGLHVVS